MTALARNRQLTVTADATTNQTGWITLKKGGVVTIRNAGTNPFTLQRMGSDGNAVDVTNNAGATTVFTANGTYTITPTETPAQYRLNCKSGAYVSGTSNVMIEGR